MDSYTSIPMSQNVYGNDQTIVNPLPVLTGSSLPLTFYHEFLKGKPLAIGTVVIVVSLIQIALGINGFLHLSYLIGPYSFFTGTVFWAPIFYIITGSLMIAGKHNVSICLVNSSMILNIITSFISCIGMILAGIDISILTHRCGSFHSDSVCRRFEGMATSVLFLVSDVLLLSLFIYSAVSGGRSMKHLPSIPQAHQTSKVQHSNCPV
ncbi:membrane-spanning 4-domains subfamily A member 4A-like [Eleutherodactylus coqui]|uniref:membrane-spanning 4-domains subfamily A member 4A-like n=1 Tax=Eleutherodactylus coqui TaxID=57060 RepID=UPI003462B42D